MYIALFTTGEGPLADPVPTLLRQAEARRASDALKPAPVSAGVLLPLKRAVCYALYYICYCFFLLFSIPPFVFRVRVAFQSR